MINIELHGMSPYVEESFGEMIFELFSSEPFLNDMVITIFPTTVLRALGKKQPFLRIVATENPNINKIISRIQEEFQDLDGIDIEHLKLESFYPK